MLIWNMMALLGCQGKEFCRMAPSKTGLLGLGMTPMAKAGKGYLGTGAQCQPVAVLLLKFKAPSLFIFH